MGESVSVCVLYNRAGGGEGGGGRGGGDGGGTRGEHREEERGQLHEAGRSARGVKRENVGIGAQEKCVYSDAMGAPKHGGGGIPPGKALREAFLIG